ncbi:MAG: CPBP family intramembrane metalloprotease [Chlamydiae bacterium]|nr:CPBP family intramembrane metalloprotease [Chlamydiota bacterium]
MNERESMKSKYKILKYFSDEEKKIISSLWETKTFASGSYIIREGDDAADLFFLKKGVVKVISSVDSPAEPITFEELSEGEVFGELAVIDKKPRSTSVIAEGQVVVDVIPGRKMKDLLSKQSYFEKFSSAFIELLSARLKKGNSKVIGLLKNQIQANTNQIIASNLAVIVTVCIMIWFFLNKLTLELIQKLGSESDITNTSMLILLCIFLIFLKKTKEPWSRFGFHIKNIKKGLWTTFIYTLPLLALFTFAKWVLIKSIPEYSKISLFSFGRFMVQSKSISHSKSLWMMVSYILISSPIQEIVFRGVLQTLLLRFLNMKQKLLWALVCCNLIFASTHLVVSEFFACLVFFLGLFWGWIFYKCESILCPIFSHCLVGSWGFFVLGVQFLFF